MYIVRICDNRVARIVDVLENLGVCGAKYFEEIDPQMDAVRIITGACKELTPLLTYLNALISYRLPMKGEEYWIHFAKYTVNKPPRNVHECLDLVKDFVKAVHGIAISRKLERLRKLRERLDIIWSYIKLYDLGELWRFTARALNSKPDSKTVTFSIKMTYYGYRALGHDMVLPMEIPIPVDIRVAKITYTSGVIEIVPHVNDFRIAAKILMRRRDIVVNVWNRISRLSSIPPLHIDTILWIIGGFIDLRAIEVIGEKILKLVARNISAHVIDNLVRELLRRLMV